MHRRNHALDSPALAFQMRLDRAIGKVAHPSGKAEGAGGCDRPVAVEHALDVSVDYEVGGDQGFSINLSVMVASKPSTTSAKRA